MLNRVRDNMLGGVSRPAMEVRHTGIIEGWILFSLTALAPGLSNVALGFLTTALTGLAVTAAVVGAQMLMMPKPPRPEDGKVPMMQAIPPRIYGVGTNRIAGAYMLWEEKGGRMMGVQALCGHKISGISRYYFHDDIVTTGGTAGSGMSSVHEGADGRYGNGFSVIGTRFGNTPEEPYTNLVNFLGAEGVWTNNHRGDGQASLAFYHGAPSAKDFPKRFPNGAPQTSVVADLAELWDPRDPAQSPTNPATWTFSKNAALAMIWHQCFNPFGPREDYTKAILPVVDIWKEEADICDEDVPRASGGSEKRYEVNGWGTTETDPIAIENSILASCDGWLLRPGDGSLILRVGKFREDLVMTVTDADIVGHMIQYDVPEEEAINRLVPKFTYPATDYTTSDADYFDDVEAQLKDGRILASDAVFGWVHQWRQARRLAKREWLRIQQKVRGTLDFRLSGFNAVYSRWIRLETPVRLPHLNGAVFENRNAVLSLMQGGFQMQIAKHPDNIEEWNPAVDEGSAPPVPSKPVSEGIPDAVIDTVAAVSASGSVILRFALIDPNREDLTPVVAYRLKDAGGGTPGSWTEQAFPDWEASGGLVTLDTAPVPNDRLLEVRAAFRATRGTLGNWSAIEEVGSTVDSVPPQALTGFTLSGAAPYLGRASFTMTTQNDSHLDRVALYRVPVGVSLDRALHLVTKIPVTRSASTYSYVDGDATRTNLIANAGFDTDTVWTKGAGWTISGGRASHAAGTAANLTQTGISVSAVPYRFGFALSSVSAGGARFFTNAPTVAGGYQTASGNHFGTLTPDAATTIAGVQAQAAFAGSVDNVVLYQQTAGCAPSGDWQYYAIPENASGIEGAVAGPLSIAVF